LDDGRIFAKPNHRPSHGITPTMGIPSPWLLLAQHISIPVATAKESDSKLCEKLLNKLAALFAEKLLPAQILPLDSRFHSPRPPQFLSTDYSQQAL
jgi:hypothetical protein